MKQFWRKYLVILLVAVFSGGLLLKTSQTVEMKENTLRALEREKAAEEEKLRVLRAEWAYLNRPDNLEAMAAKYLPLVPPQGLQGVTAKTSAPGIYGDMPDANEIPVYPGHSPARQEAQTISAVFRMVPAKPARKPVIKTKSVRSFKNVLEDVNRFGQGDENAP